MKLDEIYGKCAEYCQVDIPPDLGSRGMDAIIDIQSKIRKGMSFCGTYMPLANQKLGEAKQKFFAAKTQSCILAAEMLRAGKYAETMKNSAERKNLILMETQTSCGLNEAEGEVEKFKHLHAALRETVDNLKSAKEQLSSLMSTMREEMNLSKSGGSYNTTQDVTFENLKL
jgi:hypothetical protein